ncbi:TP53-target gene 5 protein [Phocoena phocoena]|uniref:TP53-target gene 5 protein n=1 Tax=Phocoena phocoena TaxID=9742 RepID=UPI003306BF34
MSPSAKKRLKNTVVSKMQDEEPRDKIQQPVSKVIARNRLKVVLKNLSLLKLLESSNPRTQELHNLAKRCWNSLLRVPKIRRVSSGHEDVWDTVEQNNKDLQEAGCPNKKLDSKKSESLREPEDPEQSRPKAALREGHTAQQAVPHEEEWPEPEVPVTSKGRGRPTGPGAQERQSPTADPRIVFLKTHQYRPPVEDMKQLDTADQWTWCEGLPTRVHLPGPRVMCRPSALRWVKRCCTRLCSASLELPMVRPYKLTQVGALGKEGTGSVVLRWVIHCLEASGGAICYGSESHRSPSVNLGARGVRRGRRSRNHLNRRDGRENSRVYK